MKLFLRSIQILCVFCVTTISVAQQTMPMYSDYLSDNIFLVHPSAAGIGNCAKIRFTGRQQWIGVPNAPALQTLSYHSRVHESFNTAYGVVLYNDQNGYHSQRGIRATYAYHLPLGNPSYFNQLSFALSVSAMQSQVDQRSFQDGDPAVIPVVDAFSHLNADFSMAYHKESFSSYLTIKNLLPTPSSEFEASENINLRNYVASLSYFFGEERFIQVEPSFLLQYQEATGEAITDLNIKAYKGFDEGRVWAAVSYRRSLETSILESAHYVSPILGVNYKNTMLSYTFTRQLNDILISEAGLHQITLGINLNCVDYKGKIYRNINAIFSDY